MIETLSVEQVTQMLMAACDAIISSKELLTQVDSAIGDGDHGIGMAGGMSKAKEALLQKQPFADVNTVFKTMGMTMLRSMGGASGVIFGTMFMGGVKGLSPMTALDSAGFTQIMRGSLDSIKERGKAQLGDKTMVDALEPAVVAMESCGEKDMAMLLFSAMQAAQKGMEDTKGYVAKHGRAKSLMDRAIGFQDAGATSVAILFQAMYEFVRQLSS